MSKDEILEQLPGLTPAERFDILVRLTELAGDLWLDHDDALTDEDKALIEERMHSHEASPDTAVPWNDFKARTSQRLVE